MKFLSNKMKMKLFNLWPPFLGAGIRIDANEDVTVFDVSMKLGKLNQNYVGTHYGGSLYSMCDPFYMLILMTMLGKEYIVWDKAASIQFVRPGKGRVSAHFEISEAELEDVKKQVEVNGKYEPKFEVQVLDEKGSVVATVQKTLWVKKKT